MSLFVGLPLNIKRHVVLYGLSVDDGEVHDLLDPYPPPQTQAAYWPEKKLEDELKQLSFDPQQAANAGQESGGPVQTVINHAWQFFRSIYPQASRNVGLMNSKQKTSARTALIYKNAQTIAAPVDIFIPSS